MGTLRWHETPSETGELTKEHLGEQVVAEEEEQVLMMVVLGSKGGDRERFIEREEEEEERVIMALFFTEALKLLIFLTIWGVVKID